MPIKIPNKLPAASVLERENIFFMDADRAYGQDIRPLRLCILNLMPVKSVTETQLLRLLGNSPLQVEIDFIYTESYLPQHTSQEYLTEFYGTFAEVRNRKYDGFLMTGAPVEQMPFEEVAYWEEVCDIMEWSKTHAFSSFYICWGAQAGLYYHYGIPKHPVPEKIFGVFRHHLCVEHEKLFRGFDDEFYVPHSRHTEVRRADLARVPELTVMAEAESPADVYCVANLAVLHYRPRRIRPADPQKRIRPRPGRGDKRPGAVQLLSGRRSYAGAYGAVALGRQSALCQLAELLRISGNALRA